MTTNPVWEVSVEQPALAPDHIVAESRDRPLHDQRRPPRPMAFNAGFVPDLAPVSWVREHHGWAALSTLVFATTWSAGGGPGGFLGAVIALVVAFAGMKGWRNYEQNRVHAAAVDYNEARQVAYNQVLDWWQWTRPMNVVARSTDPLRQLMAYRTRPDKTLYLGVDQDTESLVLAPRNLSILILGVTQVGKTTKLVNPMIMSHLGPVVVVSTKEDSYRATYLKRGRVGSLWLFDPSGQTQANQLDQAVAWTRWSPVDPCSTWDDSKRMAATMVGATPTGGEKQDASSAHWKVTAEQLLATLLLAANLHQDTTVLDVRRWANLADLLQPLLIMTAVAEDGDHPQCAGAALALEYLNAAELDDPRHRSSTFATIRTVLDAYAYESAAASCTEANFDAEAFVRSSDTLYVTASADRQASVAPIIVGLVSQLARATVDLNRAEPFMTSSRDSLLLVLDEAANSAPMKELPTYLSQGGGQGLQAVVVLQSIAQAEQAWPVQARAFMDYFGIKVAFGGTSDDKTLEALSALTGDHLQEYRSINWSKTQGETEGWSSSSGISGGYLTGHSQRSTGEHYSTSTSYTQGESLSYRKERRLSKADIATLPLGQGLAFGPGGWRNFDLAGLGHPAWSKITASTVEIAARPEPATIEPTTRTLPSLDELLDAGRQRLRKDTRSNNER